LIAQFMRASWQRRIWGRSRRRAGSTSRAPGPPSWRSLGADGKVVARYQRPELVFAATTTRAPAVVAEKRHLAAGYMSLQRTDAEAAPEALSAAGAVAWPVRFGCSSAAEPPVAQRWRRRRRPARGSDQAHSRGPHRAQQLCVGRVKRRRAPAPMGSGGAGVDKFAHLDPGVSTGGTCPGARESSTFVGFRPRKGHEPKDGRALTLRSARSTVSERSPFAAFSRMARPGLEPGTPRFSVVCSTN
jgi:hypothetical protein